MKILFIQHSAADVPGAADTTLNRPEHHLETVRIDRGDTIPASVDFDALMMFGGPISLTGTERPDWVAREQALIRNYVNEGRRVFGICLGSQMIASALGADVRRNTGPEVGWHDVERVDGSESALIDQTCPKKFVAFHWHQDTFGIPPGSTHLFRSQACENQAYVIDDRVFGFQFHLEANPRTIATFLAVSSLAKRTSPFVQTKSEINAGIETFMSSQHEILAAFLNQWLAA